MNYSSISNFGPNTVSEVNNPLSYCMNNNADQQFLHGSSSYTLGQYSKPCQIFMSEYCSQGWDGFCEKASQNNNSSFPNQVLESCPCSNCPNEINGHRPTAGQILIHNTAARKYLVHMYNGEVKSELFDPNVPTSPRISYYVPDTKSCFTRMIPVYAVDPKTIDNDIVMDKILAEPGIFPVGLINIYNTMKKHNTLKDLKGTKLGNFYNNVKFFKDKGGLGI